MASLTRGISFRRQGSSGLSWADTWTFNDEGMLVRTTREDAHMHQQQRFGGSSLARIHDSHEDDDGDTDDGVKYGVQEKGHGVEDGRKKAESSAPPPAASVLGLRRSRSVGSATTTPSVTAPTGVTSVRSARPNQNTASRILRWLKKTFGKRKRQE